MITYTELFDLIWHDIGSVVLYTSASDMLWVKGPLIFEKMGKECKVVNAIKRGKEWVGHVIKGPK